MQKIRKTAGTLVNVIIKATLVWSLMFVSNAYSQDWNNGGGNPQRNGLVDVAGPTTDSLAYTINYPGLFGNPVYIEGNRFITMRYLSGTDAPIECYDLNSGTLLWSKDITGNTARTFPIGFKNGQVYVIKYTESLNDSLFALDAATGNKIWASEKTIATGWTTSANFASNGDLLVEAWLPEILKGRMCRIDYQTGNLIWESMLLPPVVGESEITVYQNTGYFIHVDDADNNAVWEIYVRAIDLNTGLLKYDSPPVNDTHLGGGTPESSIMVGKDGTVYYHKNDDNVTAFRDDGTQLSFLWETEILENSPFGHMCTGADGSIYAPSQGKVIRLNPLTGAVLNESININYGSMMFMRTSAASNGMIYVTNSQDSVYAFNQNLEKVWADAVPGNNLSGPCLASNGRMVVAGAGIIKVYEASGVSIDNEDNGIKNSCELFQNYPNPFNPRTTISFYNKMAGNVKLTVLNAKGETVATLINGSVTAGNHQADFNGATLNSGVYFYKLETPTATLTKKMLLVK